MCPMASISNRELTVDDNDDVNAVLPRSCSIAFCISEYFDPSLPSPFQDFDWEAAVKEIDVTCLSGIHSASSHSLHPSDASAETPSSFPFSKENEKRGTSRQSTLHRFIVNPNAKPRKISLDVEQPVEDPSLVEHSVGLVDIDEEAAKTWIYPGESLNSELLLISLVLGLSIVIYGLNFELDFRQFACRKCHLCPLHFVSS